MIKGSKHLNVPADSESLVDDMRLDKFIAKSTQYALVEAIAIIISKRVAVNGVIVIEATHQVHQNNAVTLDGGILTLRSFRYIMLNKPVDTICSNVDEKHPSLFNILDVENVSELHIAGRLDADTTGLVLITDDGHWSFNLTSPKNQCEKMYTVQLSRPISLEAVKRFQQGLFIKGDAKITLPATLHIIDPYNVLLILTEGRYHQVKRMFAAIGNRVKLLHRHQISSLVLDVEVGQWRNLSATEVADLTVIE